MGEEVTLRAEAQASLENNIRKRLVNAIEQRIERIEETKSQIERVKREGLKDLAKFEEEIKDIEKNGLESEYFRLEKYSPLVSPTYVPISNFTGR